MKHNRGMILIAGLVGTFFANAGRGDLLHVPGDFADIRSAVEAAKPGDEVVVADGVYTGPGNRAIDFAGKDIVLRSANGPDNCTIDCEQQNRAFWLHSGETRAAIIDGITISNGRPASRGLPGGGMLIEGASPTVRNCMFANNWVRGSLGDGAGAAVSSGSPLFDRCRFLENTVEGQNGGRGGGLYSDGSPTITDCLFSGNITWNKGGGICSTGPAITITGSSFLRNYSHREGGGGLAAVNALVMDSDFLDNRADENGGAIRHDDGLLKLVRCSFVGNFVSNLGGHVLVRAGEARIEQCSFLEGRSVRGGALYLGIGGRVYLADCAVWKNFSQENGGGIAVSSGSLVAVNCSLAENSTWSLAGAVWTSDQASATLDNCVLWGNTPREAWGNVDISYSIVRGGWPGEGNIDADPLFVDADTGDLRLLPGSPAIDSGNNLAVAADVFDLDGDGDTEEPVPFDLDGYGRFVDDLDTEDTGRCDDPCALGIVDMGAYEFGMAMGACCIAQIGDCTDDVPDEDCIDNGGRFAAGTLCAQLDPPCVAPPCLRDPQWQCDGDVDGDGQVNPVDSGLVQAAFGSIDDQDLCNYDIDCDNQINPVDSGIVQSLFGTCDPPRGACP